MSQPGPAAPAGNRILPDVPGRILGIDAGGSGTRVILVENGTVTPRPDGPPMNALLTAASRRTSARSSRPRTRPPRASACRESGNPATPATSARP